MTGLPIFAQFGDDSAKAEGSLDVAVRLSAIATRNVRVNQGTAADVTIGCHDFVNGAIHNLIERVTSDRKSISAALTLCGLVLDLHMRCISGSDELKSWTSPRRFQIR